jgi:hypothetical protein
MNSGLRYVGLIHAVAPGDVIPAQSRPFGGAGQKGARLWVSKPSHAKPRRVSHER